MKHVILRLLSSSLVYTGGAIYQASRREKHGASKSVPYGGKHFKTFSASSITVTPMSLNNFTKWYC